MTPVDGTALGLDADLLEILACPAPDHGTLVVAGEPADGEPAGENPGLRCTSCGRRYPVTDGIPVLLLSEASGGAADPGGRAGSDDPAAGADRGV